MLPVQPVQSQDLCLKLRNLIYFEKWQRPCAIKSVWIESYFSWHKRKELQECKWGERWKEREIKQMKDAMGPDFNNGSLLKGRMLLYDFFWVEWVLLCGRELFELLRMPCPHNPMDLCRRNRLIYAGHNFIRGQCSWHLVQSLLTFQTDCQVPSPNLVYCGRGGRL